MTRALIAIGVFVLALLAGAAVHLALRAAETRRHAAAHDAHRRAVDAVQRQRVSTDAAERRAHNEAPGGATLPDAEPRSDSEAIEQELPSAVASRLAEMYAQGAPWSEILAEVREYSSPAIRDIYQREGAEDVFWKRYGPLPVHPIGFSAPGFSSVADNDGPELLEPRALVAERIGAANRATPSPLRDWRFATAGFRDDGGMTLAIGPEMRFAQIDTKNLLGMLAKMEGVDLAALAESDMDRLRGIVKRATVTRREARALAWPVIRKAIRAAIASHRWADVRAFAESGGHMYVFRDGDDAELDSRIDALRNLRADIRAEMGFSRPLEQR